MLESVYLTLMCVSFLCLILSLVIGNKESTKMISKLMLAGISMALFSMLALASADIEIAYCTTTSCSTHSFFYGSHGYIFWTIGLIASFLQFVFSFLLVIDIYRHGTFRDKYDPTLI